MRRPALSRDLVPVHELRAELAAWLRRVEQEGRTVVITQRGKAAAVLIPPEALDEIEDTRALLQRVLRGLDDIAQGRVVDDEEVWSDVEGVLQAAERGQARQGHEDPVE